MLKILYGPWQLTSLAGCWKNQNIDGDLKTMSKISSSATVNNIISIIDWLFPYIHRSIQQRAVHASRACVVSTWRAGVDVSPRHTHALPGGHVLPGDVCWHPRQKKHKDAKRRLHLLVRTSEQCPELCIYVYLIYIGLCGGISRTRIELPHVCTDQNQLSRTLWIPYVNMVA